MHPATMAQPQDIPAGRPSRDAGAGNTSNPPRISTSMATSRLRKLTLDTFSPSPITQNGSYDFDRVLKSGFVHKRTRKTKSWKPIYLVLRPTSLSIYKDQREVKLRHKIQLADLTAVAKLKDPKGKRDNLFGLFSPARNYHLEASTTKDAEEWVDLIRQEARIEEEEEEMFLASPSVNVTNYAGLDEAMKKMHEENKKETERHRLYSSSPEPIDPVGRPRISTSNAPDMGVLRRPSHFDYSGNEPASHSDMSDNEPLPHPPQIARQHPGVSELSIPEDGPMKEPAPARPSFAGRNASQQSGLNANAPNSPDQDPERIIWQGHLLYLKSKSGVRQWKDLWAVLRVRSFALYKDENEYRPVMVLDTNQVLGAVEVEPISRSKRHCLQVITEEKRLRFCAPSEEAADRALGAFKSILSRRNGEGRRADLSL